jgi:putative MATE family efflux protein
MIHLLKNMTEGPAGKLILAFAVPMFIGNIFQQLYNMVDSIVVGRYVGPQALAAVGTSFPVIFLLISLAMGLTMGSGVIISQYFGAGQNEQVRKAASTAMIFQTVFGLAASVVGVFFSRPLLQLLRTPPDVIDASVTYMTIFFGGLIFMFTYNTLSSTLRALGDSRTPLYFLIIAAVINTVLDVIFVASFGWGVAGVAWATLIAQAISSILCLVYIRHRVPLLRFSRQEFVFDREMFRTMVRIGIPSALQQSVLSLGFMAMQGLINSFGSVTMAAYTAASRLDSFAMMPIQNFSMALSTFVGQNVGANRFDRVREGLRSTLAMTIGVCLVASLLIYLIGPQLIQIFIDAKETEVIARGVGYLRTVSLFYVIFSVMVVVNGVLRGAGDTVLTMVSSLVGLGTRVGVAYWLASLPAMGYRGIWWAIGIGWTVGTIVPVVRYLTGGWKQKAVIRQQMLGTDSLADDTV